MGKDIVRSYKYNQSKISTSTLKKPVLSSSSNYTSYATSLSQTIISSQLENNDSAEIQNTSDISNTDDIHSCVTPRGKNQATSTLPVLIPLITTLPLVPVELTKTTQLPPVGK